MQAEQSQEQLLVSVQSSNEYQYFLRNTLLPKHKLRKQQLTPLARWVQDYPEHRIKLNVRDDLPSLFLSTTLDQYRFRGLVLQNITWSFKNNRVKMEYMMGEDDGRKSFIKFIECVAREVSKYNEVKKSLEQTIQNEQQLIFQNFKEQINQLISSDITNGKQQLFFKCLQQTDIFYQCSLLFRIKNCSVAQKISTNQNDILKKFKQIKFKDQSLSIQYNNQKKRNKTEAMREKAAEIDKNMMNFFKLLDPNVRSFVREQHEPSFRIKLTLTLKQIQKLTFQSKVKDLCGFTDFIKQTYTSKRSPLNMFYQIRYCSQKHYIVVKLFLPSNSVNVQNSDFLTYQTNIVTYDALNISVNLQNQLLIPQNQNSMKPQGKIQSKKIVTFKGTSTFNTKEPVIQKILLLMDMCMIAARVFESELIYSKHSIGKHGPQRMLDLSDRVAHYTSFCMRVAKRIYCHG